MDELPMTMDGVLRARAAARPDHQVLTVAGRRLTYAELDEMAAVAGSLFADLGVEKGHHAAVMLPNCPEFVQAWLGLARLGAVEVPINTAYRGDLLTHVLGQTASRVVVVAAGLADRIVEVAPDLPALEHVLVVDVAVGDEAGDGADAAGLEVPGATVHDWADALAATTPRDLPDVTVPEDRSVILYTSGTTGPSKGVVLTHKANVRLARTMSEAAGFERGEVLFTPFPLFHVAARYVSVLAAMLVDGSVVVAERFSASGFWRTCADEGVTAIHYLGSLLTLLLKQPRTDTDRDHGIRIAYGAGAPLPVWEEVEERFGLRLFELFGLTETGMVTMNREGAYRRGSCGKVIDDCRVMVVDEMDYEVPPGTVGEIVVRPEEPHTMLVEYLAMPEATAHAFRNLWFHTGDRGWFDEDGYLYFDGRSKDSLRRRGENISAYEVETVVSDHADVANCAVIGVPDDISGEEVLVAVQPQPGATIDPVALLDHCQGRLAHFAVPRYVRVFDQLPMNTSQRVEKYRLRKEGVTADTWDREDAGYVVRR